MARQLALLLPALLLFACLPACGDGEEVEQIRDGVTQTWDGVKAWTVKKRQQAEPFLTAQLAELEDEFRAAQAQAAEKSDDASAALQSKWDDLSEKLAALKAAGAEEWGDLLGAFVKAYEAFKAELAAGEER